VPDCVKSRSACVPRRGDLEETEHSQAVILTVDESRVTEERKCMTVGVCASKRPAIRGCQELPVVRPRATKTDKISRSGVRFDIKAVMSWFEI
jgi:hypothetical protein